MARTAIRLRRHDDNMARRIGTISLHVLLALAFSVERARGQEARPAARGAGAAALARRVPLKDLVAYLEFDGLDAHAEAWRASAAYKLLNDTQLGTVLEDLLLQGIELIQEATPAEQRATGAEVVGFIKHIARNGFVVAVSRKGPGHVHFFAVLRHADRPEFKRLLEIAETANRLPVGQEKSDRPEMLQAGRTVHPLGAHANWLVEKGDLILTSMTNADALLALQSGHQQSAMDHPLRAELIKAADGLRPAAIGFMDMQALAPLTPDAVDLGLGGLKWIDLQWGFQDGALVTRLRVAAPTPRQGVLALLDQPEFGVDTLPPLPANLTGLFVLSVDLAKTYDQVETLMKRINPQSPTDSPNVGILARHGIDLRKELLGHVGPRLAFCMQAPRGEDAATAASMLMSQVAGFTLTAQVRDEAAVSRAIDSLIKSFTPMLREYLRGIPRNRVASSLAFLKFQKLPGRRLKYALDLPPNSLPQPYVTMARPTVMLGQDRLVVSASTPAAEQALADGPFWQPDGAFIPVVKRLPAKMVYLGLIDPRAGTAVFTKALPLLIRQLNAEIALAQRRMGKAPNDVFLRLDPGMIPDAGELDRLLFPSSTALTVDRQGATLIHREAIPTLTSPATAAILVALEAPALQESLEAARRVQCVNNLKQIALAMHNYHGSNNAFPRPATLDQKGKPLLSWRVAILPSLQQQELYDKFKQDEPWDSPHNKALLKEMPPVYRCPIRSNALAYTTNYQVFVGKDALFENDQGIGVADVTDGTSNTIMIVEAKEAVPWTKPDDLSFDPAAAPSLRGAGSPHPGGFHASMADGSVRFLKNTIDLNVLRALITRAGGEVIAAGAF